MGKFADEAFSLVFKGPSSYNQGAVINLGKPLFSSPLIPLLPLPIYSFRPVNSTYPILPARRCFHSRGCTHPTTRNLCFPSRRQISLVSSSCPVFTYKVRRAPRCITYIYLVRVDSAVLLRSLGSQSGYLVAKLVVAPTNRTVTAFCDSPVTHPTSCNHPCRWLDSRDASEMPARFASISKIWMLIW